MTKNVETSYGQNMLCITTYWGQDKTFKLMPISNDCPYMEVIYDTATQMLVAISKTFKENFEMLPRLDDDGEIQRTKKPKRNGKEFKEHRMQMSVPQEYYMVERAEQESFIEAFACNAEDFNYKLYLDMKPKQNSEILKNTEAGKILDKDGKALSVAK
jgi:hypothetical protein